jgi:hypothetical protein
MEAGPNLYLYVVSNPITYFDSSGHDKVDKFKGCYVATFDSLILGKRTSLFFHSDSFSAGYKTCYWSDRLRERVDQSDVARTIRNDVVNTEASARLIGAVLGLMSAFVPNAPDGSDLPPVIQDEYRKFRFASTMATIVVGGAEGLKSRPPGSPSAPTPALSLAGNATVGSANAAAIVRSEAISPALVASSSLSNLNANMVRPRKERDAPAKPASDKPPKGKSTAPKAPLSDKQLHRIEIQEAIKEFEASGGQIEKIHSQPHLHHLLPQELRGKFEKLQLDIEKFKIWLDPKVHLEHVHGGAPEGGLWNQTWKEFFTQNPNATVTQVKDQLARMRRSFGI